MKSKHEKISLLQDLSEDSLRQEVLIPLLSKMGFIDPIHHHHQNEKGKDIVCKEYDQVFKKTKYIAVIVKKGNITGSSSSSDGYFNVINQIKQALNEPYKHVYELREIYIDQCLLVASGKFLATSLESIYGTLKQERLDKAIRDTIDIDRLISLIDDHFPEYWDEHETEKEFLVKQRNTLLNNVAKIIKLIIPDSNDQKKALRIISNTDTDLELFKLLPLNKFSAHLSYKKLSIDEIDEYYTDNIVNPYADIKEAVYSIKKEAQSILSDFDEVAFILEDILKAEDPLKVIEYCIDLRSYVNGYGRLDVGGATDLHQQDDFYYGVMNYRDKKEFLIENNLLEFFRNLKSSAEEIISKSLIDFLKKYPRDRKNMWLGCKLIIPSDVSEKQNIEMCEFERDYLGKPKENSKIIKNNRINEIVIEIAINNYGIYQKEKLSYEAQAQSLLWHFTDTIEKEFFILKGYEEAGSD
jgi:hypothetical protein